jgi:hypothetical protein
MLHDVVFGYLRICLNDQLLVLFYLDIPLSTVFEVIEGDYMKCLFHIDIIIWVIRSTIVAV